MKKPRSLEFIKDINSIDLIASLLVNMCKSNNINFILLKGDIGSGKTTLVKEIAKFFNENKEVVSPSFNKMFVYNDFVHIDAYNLENESLDQYEDFFEDKIVIIEWAEKLNHKFQEAFNVEISYVDDNQRKYKITWKD